MEKEQFQHIQTLILANLALLSNLIDEMHEKGLINKDSISHDYENNLQETVDKLSKK